MTAAAVHHVPGVEVARPALHLLRGDLGWIVHHAREDARLVNARGPQLLREPVIGADLPGQLVQHWCRNAVRLLHMQDRKSTRLNSSHGSISYAVFCLKKKTKENN